MHNNSFHRWLYLVAGLLFSMQLSAQSDSATINREARDPDFIHASMVVASPGEPFYSCVGHAAIRMECPSKDLDYCFSFEMEMEPSNELMFIFGKSKGGFVSVDSKEYFKIYQKERRGIKSYEFNLTPKEKQNLWKNLDEEVSKGMSWDYDFLGNQCTAMLIYILEKSLIQERVEYRNLAPPLTASYDDYCEAVAHDMPWTKLLMQIKYHTSDSGNLTFEDYITPELLFTTYQKAVFTDAQGRSRPVFIGKEKEINKNQLVISKIFFTPSIAFTAFIIVLISSIIWWRLRKRNKK